MTASKVLAQLRRLDIRLWCEDGHLRYDAPRGALTDELRARIASCRAELLALLEQKRDDEEEQPILPLLHHGNPPLAFGQQRLWFVEQIQPGNLAYNVPATVRLHGVLDTHALNRALQEVVRRHETLRTSFPTVNGEPNAVIASSLELTLAADSLEALPESERLPEAIRRAREAAAYPFDLDRGPLLRVQLYRLASDHHVLHVSMHHIISDGWSMGVFFRELGQLYAVFGEQPDGTPSPLPDLAIQYADYAQWQRDQLDGDSTGLAYWKQQLGRDLPTLDLPTDYPRPTTPSHEGAFAWIPIRPELYRQLQALCQQRQATLFQVLLAAFATLLVRTTGQEDIVFGTPVAGRGRRELEELIGFFVNTLVLRADVSGDPTFGALLDRMRPMVLDAFAHQDVPFEKIVDELQPQRELGRNPLFQVLFNHFNLQQYTKTLGKLTLDTLDASLDVSKFDLTLHCFEDRGRLVTKLEYRRDLFTAASIERIGRHYVTLLSGIVAEPDQKISRLPLMDADEQHELMVEWNQNSQDESPRRCVHEAFIQQARLSPGNPALLDEHGPITYQQLDEQTDRLAHHLLSLGIQAEARVALLFERSPQMIVALFGVLKAGAAYVPLDVHSPTDRLSYLLGDSHAQVVLTQSSLMDKLVEYDGPVVCLDGDWGGDQETTEGVPLPKVSLDQIAYVIYTSGSTGQPKGVEVEHAQLANYVQGILPVLDLPPGARYATVSTIAADLGHTAIFPSLCSGGALYVMPESFIGDADAFATSIREQAIDCIKIVPSHLDALLTAAANPFDILPRRLLVLGGEACTWELIQRVQSIAPECAIVNHYGPTESTVGVLTHRFRPGDRERFPLAPPIGRPTANTQVYILDRGGAPVPVGAIGELHVGGSCVARGYHGRPELTAEKFIRDPFGNKTNARLYRTGDLARYLPSGHLLFLGRRDDQVKLRGFRVELGEVQVALERHAGVAAAAVVIAPDENGTKLLVAYFTSADSTAPSLAELRLFLREQLPDYMVPVSITLLDRIPLTANGKLDRAALPAPEIGATPGGEYQPPRTPTEITLARIWSEVLRVESLGIHDDFFEIGGDSILSIQIISRANQAGLRLTPRDLFEHSTLAELALVASPAPQVQAEQGLVVGSVPLTPILHRFFEQDLADPQHYNHAMLLKLRRPIETEVLEAAVARLLEHQDALRLRLKHTGDSWSQSIADATDPVPFTYTDLSGLPPGERATELEAEAARLQASLNLTQGPLLRVAQFKLGEDELDRLLIVIHHAAVDGVSWRIVLEDLDSACTQLAAGNPVRLPPKTTSFKAWAEQLAEYAQSDDLQSESDYWLQTVGEQPARLPRDHEPADGDLAAANVAVHSNWLPEADTRALLQQVPKAYHTQINDVLLAALAETIAEWTGSRSVRLDLEAHGREDLFPTFNLSRTVGWFTAVYPVCLTVLEGVGSGERLKSIKEQLRSIPRRGIGWGVLRYLAGQDERSHWLRQEPAAEMTFNYLGQFDQMFDEASLFESASEPMGPPVSPRNRRQTLLDVIASVTQGRLRVNWVYNRRVHDCQTVERLSQQFLARLRELIAHCSLPEAHGHTPSDFPLAHLNAGELAAIEQRLGGRGIEDIYRLSPLQEGLLFHTLTSTNKGTYVTQLAVTLAGELDSRAFRSAWQGVLDANPVLRTAFVVDGLREMHQVVCREAPLRWAELDWSDLPPAEQDQRLLELARADHEAGFNVDDPPLMCFHLVRLSPDRSRFLWTHHHVLLDGWSLPLLIRDVFTGYAALREGKVGGAPSRPPFSKYVAWLGQQDTARAEAFWRDLLADWAEPTPLPFSPVTNDVGRGTLGVRLPAETTDRLNALARRNRLTLNTLVLGAWALLLARHSGHSEVLFGVTVSGRPADLFGVERMLGLLINTLPVRVRVDDAPLLAWLTDLQAQQVKLRQFEHSALYEVQQFSAARERGPLFESIFVFENFPFEVAEPIREGGLQITDPSDTSHATYPLAAVVQPGARLSLQLRYDRERFKTHIIEHLLQHLSRLLESMSTHPESRLSELSMLDETELDRQLRSWNNTRRPYPHTATVQALFESQAAQTPDATAVVFGDQALTYGELNARANQLAHYLARQGVEHGSLVALWLERGVDMVVAMLGILKCGAAYVPLDPDYPPQRLAFMLEDSGAAFLLTGEALEDRLTGYSGTVIRLDADWSSIAAAPVDNPAATGSGQDLAYVIYTSGSTGRPKGTCVPHRAITRLVVNTDYVSLMSEDRIAQASNASFDAATFEIWGALLNGASLVGIEKDVALSPRRMATVLRERQVTVLFVTTALFNQLVRHQPDIFAPLRYVLFGGEAVDPRWVRQVLQRGRPQHLLHMYGPTECTTYSTWYEVDEVAGEALTIPIGRPIANSTMFVLDNDRNPTPVGALGELYLGGDGLAHGYHNRPDLTAERFVANPFSDDPKDRLYRTGDLVRQRPDGHIEFVGRADHQVKVRGFRIELGEIEAVLKRHASVREIVVLCREDEPGDKQLVAYVVARSEPPPSRGELRAHVGRTLPDYMVPVIVFLEAMPLNQNGKIERQSLPVPEGRQVDQAYVAPRSRIEEQIAVIWREVLGVERVGLRDNFFDLGGHSLKLLRVHARLVEDLGCTMSVTDLFQYTSVEAVARQFDGGREAERSLRRVAAARLDRVDSQVDRRIAVIAMAGRFPGAPDVETFWQNLCDGVESVRFFSDDELRQAGVSEALIRNPQYVKARATIDGADLFDARLFGYTPREAELIDPQQRLFLECAWEGLERAGHDPERFDGLIGVVAGCSMNTYLRNLESRPEVFASLGGMQALISSMSDFLPTRVSYKLNLRGPSVNVQTACSTSLVAIHQACQSLLDHQCDMAMAGGTAVTVPSTSGYLYQESGVRSLDGHCRPFDARAEGMVSGNGVAVVVLKRLQDALRDRDPIQAVICGTAINNDGSRKIGYTAPSIDGQAEVIAAAQAAADVEPSSIGYVEAHGTGTALGDPIEVAALTKVFREQTHEVGFCALGSLKSNMGHLDATAGVAGLIKAALAVKHGKRPPSLHYERPNPEIDFASSPFRVNATLNDWVPPDGAPRRAGVSSFGIGGTNAHAVLEEPPATADSGPSREWQLLILSAATPSALDTATANLAAHLTEHAESSLADVAYTLQVGRRELAHRRAVLCRDDASAIGVLEGRRHDRCWTRQAAAMDHPVVFMFPGQGAQYINMARGLYDEERVVRETIDECLRQLDSELEFDLRGTLYPDGKSNSAPELLKRTAIAQPALFIVEYALAQLWRSWGIEPAACIGHSIGEYVAACLSGVLELDDALRLVAARGRFMERMPEGVMLAVPLPEHEVRDRLATAQGVWLATVNGPSLCVVSGSTDSIDAFEQQLSDRGVEGRRLHTSHAFHSGLMEGAVEPLVDIVREIAVGTPRIPYLSNVSGDWITPSDVKDPRYWGRHLRETVRFGDGIARLLKDERYVLLEVGPGQVLGSLARQHSDCGHDRVVVSSLRHPQATDHDVAFLMSALGRLWTAGVHVDWSRFHEGERRRRVTLPTYPFQRQRYWIERQEPRATKPIVQKDIADWYHVRVWRPAPSPVALPDAECRCWLVFSDGSALAQGITRFLLSEVPNILVVNGGSEFERTENGYTIDPRSPRDYHRLIADLKHRGLEPDEAVHLWSLLPQEQRPLNDEAAQLYQDRGFFALLYLAQALGEAEVNGPVRITSLTDRIHQVTGEELVQPDAATILGLCRVIGLEFSNFSCRNIDLASDELEASDGRSLAPILQDLVSSTDDAVAAYRRGRRFVESFAPVALPAVDGRRPARLREGGTYLITGGFGGMGLAMANHLARSVRANLILTGRTPLPQRDSWDDHMAQHGEDDTISQRIRMIEALEEAGADVLALQADVADLARMREVLSEARSRFGGINGIVHAAGVPGSGVIQLKDHARAANVLSPKVDGTRVLEYLTHEMELDFMVLCSSLNSVKGFPGTVDYAAANAYLDAFARRFAADTGTTTISINWNRWRDVGMAVRAAGGNPLAENQGISNSEGVEAFRRILAHYPDQQVLISEVDLWSTLGGVESAGKETRLPFAVEVKDVGDSQLPNRRRAETSTAFQAPSNDREREIAEIWCELFGFDEIGVHDDFFELGGHSLLATQLLNQMKKRNPHVNMSLTTIFQHATIAKLAAAIDAVCDQNRMPDVDSLSDEQVERMLQELLEDNPKTTVHPNHHQRRRIHE